MRIFVLTASLVFGLTLAGCAAPADSSLEGAGDPGAEAVLDLPGEYRVAGVDGAGIDLPHGISATISANTIEVQSDCIRFAFAYTLDGSRIATEPAPVASCRRALLPDEQAISAAFDVAETVSRTPANGIEFTGGGRSVTLFSQ